MATLAIFPGCDESDESDSQSESEAEGSEVIRLQNTNQAGKAGNASCLSGTGGEGHPVGQEKNCKKESSGSGNPEEAADDDRTVPNPSKGFASEIRNSSKTDGMPSGHPASIDSGLTSEQKNVLKFLALKRRKDVELGELEEAERDERRKMERRKGGRKRQRKGTGQTRTGVDVSEGGITPTEDMDKLSAYLGVNDHLKGAMVDHGDLGPKSGLEKEIDKAVASGDVDKAEQLSNYLAARNFGARVAEAASARDYDKQKKEEEEERSAKKRRKRARLPWGFEVKHRWEMKGNM